MVFEWTGQVGQEVKCEVAQSWGLDTVPHKNLPLL